MKTTTVPYKLGMYLDHILKALRTDKVDFDKNVALIDFSEATEYEKKHTEYTLIRIKSQKLTLGFNVHKELIYITVGEVLDEETDEEDVW